MKTCIDCGEKETNANPFPYYEKAGRRLQSKRCELCRKDYKLAKGRRDNRVRKFKVFNTVLYSKWPLKKGVL